jgi:hypothetical protein
LEIAGLGFFPGLAASAGALAGTVELLLGAALRGPAFGVALFLGGDR